MAREQLLGLVATPGGQKPQYIAAYIRGLLDRHDDALAESWIAKLESMEPKALRTIALKTRLLQAQGKDREAADLLKTFARNNPDRGTTLIAALLEETGQAKAAEELFRKAAQRADAPENSLSLASHLGRQHRPKEALDICEQAWQKLPPDKVAAVSITVLRDASASNDQYDRVEGWLKAAIKRDPQQASLQTALASLWVMRRRYAEAKDLYRQVLERNQQDSLAMNNLAWLLALSDGDHAEALRLVNRAIDLTGPLPTLLDTRAVVYTAAGKNTQAIRDLNRALANSRTPASYFHLARAHLLEQQLPSARAAWEKAKAAGLSETSLSALEHDAYHLLLEQLEKK
jgi:tetratricopeptide (TPR) repeat protein